MPMDYKNSDLLSLSQSNDLAKAHPKRGLLRDLPAFLRDKVRPWLSSVTGIALNTTVDIFAARYGAGDFLLCHDDELEGRRVAYILYLVPEDWTAADGGALDLFAVDAAGRPTTVTRSLVPALGKFAFFCVSEVSFHQVAEVLSETRDRLSITGWFHGPPLDRAPPPAEPVPMRVPFSGSAQTDEATMAEWCEWMSEDMLERDAQVLMGMHMEEESTLHLPAFLRPDVYDRILQELQSAAGWTPCGPPNVCHYSSLAAEALPPLTARLFAFLRSRTFFRYLHQITELDLTTLLGEVRRIDAGCYTLCRDTDPMLAHPALDLHLTFTAADASTEVAQTVYLATGEEEPILSAQHVGNALTLVYREPQTTRFLRYQTRVPSAQSPVSFHFALTYFEDIAN